MIIRCIDVETLGLEPTDGVCEIGWCDILITEGEPMMIGGVDSILVNPGKPIPPAACAVHHIVDSDVATAPTITEAMAIVCDGEPHIFAAHHADFERGFMPSLADRRWICSYKVAVTIAPDAPEHKLQTLRYWAKLEVDRLAASPPHRAGPDAYVCAALLARMMGKMSVDDMVDISSRPVLLPKVLFGEHAMKPWSEVPQSYLSWIIHKSKGPWDPDVLHTAKHWYAIKDKQSRSRGPQYEIGG